ncbi:hypothetical protein PRNP1_011529 [Phytophthora ramorum]
MVRPHSEYADPTQTPTPQASVTTRKKRAPANAKEPKTKRPKARGAKAVAKAPAKPKKPTKKQLAQDAADRRRELSSFGNVWGSDNVQGTEERRVVPPVVLPHDASPDQSGADADANADTDAIRNAETNAPSNADTAEMVSVDKNTSAGADMTDVDMDMQVSTPERLDADSEASRDASDDSACEYNGESEKESDSEAEDGDTSESEATREIAHPLESGSRIRAVDFKQLEPTDPNLVLGSDEEYLGSDGEGSDDCAQAAELDLLASDTVSNDNCTIEDVSDEVTRVAGLMTPAEVELLHMVV